MGLINNTAALQALLEKAQALPEAGGALQEKTVTPKESEQVLEPESGYDGFSKVTVEAIDAGYVGSGVPRKAEKTYFPSTSVQKIEAGQYLSGAQTIEAMQLQSKTVTENGTVTPTLGFDGLSEVVVNVAGKLVKAGQINPATATNTLGVSGIGFTPNMVFVYASNTANKTFPVFCSRVGTSAITVIKDWQSSPDIMYLSTGINGTSNCIVADGDSFTLTVSGYTFSARKAVNWLAISE